MTTCRTCGVKADDEQTGLCRRCTLRAEVPVPDDRDFTEAARRFYDRRRPLYLDDDSWRRSPQWVHDENRALVAEIVRDLEATDWQVSPPPTPPPASQ